MIGKKVYTFLNAKILNAKNLQINFIANFFYDIVNQIIYILFVIKNLIRNQT